MMLRLSTLALGFLLSAVSACKPPPDVRTVREEAAPAGLSYHLQIDSTRLRRGTGLGAVAAVAALLEDNLSRFFQVHPAPPTPNETSREIIGESPAMGYGVRAVVEQRPDDFCAVTIEAVKLDGAAPPIATTLAPYSVHAGIAAVRSAMSSLRSASWPIMTTETFNTLRKQATALGSSGDDPPIDDATYAHAPRPLQRPDDPPQYYAPPQNANTMRGE
jgi:hypothetical protein